MVQDRNPEYFLAIASEKSISKAAERLHISQPYLSQYVIHLKRNSASACSTAPSRRWR